MSLHFEDVTVGMRFESPARTITEADLVQFAGVSGDYNQLHTDEEFARAKETPDHVVLTESALANREVAIAFKPRAEYPKAFRFFKLFR